MKTAPLISSIFITILGSTFALGQEPQRILPKQPHLYRCWTDASGETHIKEIPLGNNRRPLITGATIAFSGTPVGSGVPAFHKVGQRQFAITVSGAIDVEASDGSKAHLNVGDMFFLEDTQGKGHKTMEEGAASVFIRVPDNFDVEAWARGTN